MEKESNSGGFLTEKIKRLSTFKCELLQRTQLSRLFGTHEDRAEIPIRTILRKDRAGELKLTG